MQVRSPPGDDDFQWGQLVLRQPHAVILAIMFLAPKFRSPAMWWIMLVTMFGFYAPFWIGAPFMAELRAPFIGAEIAHLRMAIPAVLGCLLVRRHYFIT